MIDAKPQNPQSAMEINALSNVIIGCAIRVHRTIGPGALESVYSACLQIELQKAGLSFQSNVAVPVRYEGVTFPSALRLDLLIDDQIIVELKCVEKLLPVHGAQLLSYLRLTGKSLGLLINFNVKWLTEGIRRVVNNLPE